MWEYTQAGGAAPGAMPRPYINYNPLERQPTDLETSEAGQTERLRMLMTALPNLFGGGSAAGGGGMTGFTTNYGASASPGSYTSGINSAPVMGDSALANALHSAQMNATKPIVQSRWMSPAQTTAMGNAATNMGNANYQTGAVGFGRNVANVNAQQGLASQQARSNAGLAAGGLTQSMHESNVNANRPLRSWGLSTVLNAAR